MLKYIFRIFTLIAFFCIQMQNVFAQRYEGGVFLGASSYKGELNQANYFKFTDPAFGALFRLNLNDRNSVKLSFTHAKVRGDDAKSGINEQIKRDLYFSSVIDELSLQMEFNFFKYNVTSDHDKFSPYLFAGFSVFRFNPKGRDREDLQSLMLEGKGYKKISMAIPIGLGIKTLLYGNWNFFSELGYRAAFTDYLDNVSGYYPDAKQRGDLLKKDSYLFVIAGISYTFVTSSCPSYN